MWTWSHTILTQTRNQIIERGMDKRFESVIPFMKHRCANIGGTLQPITSLLRSFTVFARDDLFTNKSHSRRKSDERSEIERISSGPMQIYPPLYPTHFPEWQRYTIHTDSFFRVQVWKFNIFRQTVVRGSHEVTTRMYGKICTATRMKFWRGKGGNFVILQVYGFQWNRAARQNKSWTIFKLRLKLKSFFLLSLFSIFPFPVFVLVSF